MDVKEALDELEVYLRSHGLWKQAQTYLHILREWIEDHRVVGADRGLLDVVNAQKVEIARLCSEINRQKRRFEDMRSRFYADLDKAHRKERDGWKMSEHHRGELERTQKERDAALGAARLLLERWEVAFRHDLAHWVEFGCACECQENCTGLRSDTETWLEENKALSGEGTGEMCYICGKPNNGPGEPFCSRPHSASVVWAALQKIVQTAKVLERKRCEMDVGEAIRISKEVREEDGEAETWLRHKCNWEHMSRTAVIREWGDPRKIVKKLRECGEDQT